MRIHFEIRTTAFPEDTLLGRAMDETGARKLAERKAEETGEPVRIVQVGGYGSEEIGRVGA